MNSKYYYLSLQYSAIQKTVLRHDRLWSIAGMSQILSWLNEIELPRIASDNNGTVMVAGGGKFTAYFENPDEVESAREEIIKTISTTLPMLEFQASKIIKAENFKKAKEDGYINDSLYPGIIVALSEQKRCFRGYGVTYNPHFQSCKECGEYPAVTKKHFPDGEKLICSVCAMSKISATMKRSALEAKKDDCKTTVEKIYSEFLEKYSRDGSDPEIPLDFADLFPGSDDSNTEKGRIAVWFSDLNNMNSKVPLWLNQMGESDDGKSRIFETFEEVKTKNLEIIVQALQKTFDKIPPVERNGKKYIPFRLIVAGGDDLCIVLTDKYILDFAINYSKVLAGTVSALNEKEKDHPLKYATLEALFDKAKREDTSSDWKPPGRYCFGGSFIVTSVHTPFKKIHEMGEHLMGIAKEKTGRQWNSIHWMIMAADEESVSDKMMKFEKPLLVDDGWESMIKFEKQSLEDDRSDEVNNEVSEDKVNQTGHLYFNDYMKLCDEIGKSLSNSKIQQIACKIMEPGTDGTAIDRWLKSLPDARKKDSGISKILLMDQLRKDNKLSVKRLATLLELLSLRKGVAEDDQ